MSELEEIECRVRGKVQGVMYRDFVQRNARALGIHGTVENMPDYSVRVVAQGREAELEELIQRLHKGPFLARVSRVEVDWRKPREKYRDFKILY